MLKIGKQDVFERKYTKRFEEIAAAYGILVKHEIDRAALDLGIQLTTLHSSGGSIVTNRRVWFQLKGIQRDTITKEQFEALDSAPIDVKIDHIRFWYGSPEVIYIVVYIESCDVFLAEDIRDIVNRQWGIEVFGDKAFNPNQVTARLKISKAAILDDERWREMERHRSMRIDGPQFRGRPLGHHLDPLRCSLTEMKPGDFRAMARRLLEVHGFRETDHLDSTQLFPDSTSGDEAELLVGCLHHTFEWTCHLFTEFSRDEDSDYRNEGHHFFVQGPCAVLIHSKRCTFPDLEGLKALARRLLEKGEITELLVFVNEHVPARYIGSFRGVVIDMGLSCMPQDLSDISYNLLTATSVYLEFRDKINFALVQYLKT